MMAASSESSTSHPGVLTCLMLGSLISSTEVPRSLVSWSTSQWTARLLLAFSCRNLMLRLYEVSCSPSLPPLPFYILDKLPDLRGGQPLHSYGTRDRSHSPWLDALLSRIENRILRQPSSLRHTYLPNAQTVGIGSISSAPSSSVRDTDSSQF
jgi:hypothetical protein